MISTDSIQKDRVSWLMTAIVEENDFPDKRSVTRELKDIMKNASLPDRLNVLSEVYMSYPTRSF